MRAFFLVTTLLVLQTSVANAGEVCRTYSKGITFERRTGDGSRDPEVSVIKDCKRSLKTRNAQCIANIECKIIPLPGDRRDRHDDDRDRSREDDFGRDDHRNDPVIDRRPDPIDDRRDSWEERRRQDEEDRRREDDLRRQHEEDRRLEERRRREEEQRRRDNQCYLDRYPDICQNSPGNFCREPDEHFKTHGRGEGRQWGCN